MQSKLPDLRAAATSSLYDIIIITETWLLSVHEDSEIFDNDWNIFRKDRYQCTTRGGGVLIAIRKSLASSPVPVHIPDEVEQVWMRLSINSHYTYFCSI